MIWATTPTSVAALFAAAIAHPPQPTVSDTVRVVVTADSDVPGPPISPDFLGISFEMTNVLADADGRHYFDPSNAALLRVFEALGIRRLRLGGFTADRPDVGLPTVGDVDTLFAFAERAGVKVIYTLRLGGTHHASTDAPIVDRIVNRHGKQLLCLAIGNEPNLRIGSYEEYLALWRSSYDFLTAVAPSARYCGPGATRAQSAWATRFAADLGPSGKISLITQHLYPGRGGNTAATPAGGRARLLSADLLDTYRSLYESLAPAVRKNGLEYILEETNSFSQGGARGVSDVAASALWALDYMHWWAAHDARGVIFHTGYTRRVAPASAYPGYAIYTPTPDGFVVRPLGYALKAFDLGSHGRHVATRVRHDSPLNLTAYSVIDIDGALYVTIINKEHGRGAHPASVILRTTEPYEEGDVITLKTLPKGAASSRDLTLGDAEIGLDGAWNGAWAPLSRPSGDGPFRFNVPAASAIVVRLRPAPERP
jgi:hypothetical protein